MKIKNYFSKEGQDVLVDLLLPKSGFFLDIGCAHPKFGNNTYALELSNWKGILFDENAISINLCKIFRKSPAIQADCRNIDWCCILEQYNCPKVIDYISLDICSSNLNVLEKFPFDKYQFKIMTLETDVYKRGRIIKDKAIEVFFQYKNYSILLEDALLDSGDIWEDWWVNNEFINVLGLNKKNIFWKNYINFLKSYRILNL